MVTNITNTQRQDELEELARKEYKNSSKIQVNEECPIYFKNRPHMSRSEIERTKKLKDCQAVRREAKAIYEQRIKDNIKIKADLKINIATKKRDKAILYQMKKINDDPEKLVLLMKKM